jgi:hypothetical protein
MNKILKFLRYFIYLVCLILFLSYAGFFYINNSQYFKESENKEDNTADNSQEEVKTEWWQTDELGLILEGHTYGRLPI